MRDPLRFDRVAALGTVVLTMLVFPGCGRREARPGPETGKPVEVTTVAVAPQDVPVVYEFVAQTQSSRQVNIQARVSGFLERRVYTEGSIVKEGQVLFLMDAKPFQAQVDAQTAALAKQQAALEVARADLERTKPLAAQEALSQKDLDDATGQYLEAQAAVEQAKAQLETATLNLSYCTITSPVTGITGAAVQQDGSYVNPMNSLLTTVAALSPIWVNFSVSENEMAAYREQITKGRLRGPPNGDFEVEVILVDGSLFPHSGRITFAAPAYSAETGTFLVRASLANPDGILRPNAYVRVRLKGAVRPNAQAVPLRAVQQGPKGHFVWVVGKDNKVDMRPVTVGTWIGDDWLITGGLDPNSVVVVDGALTLTAGAAVKPQPLAATATVAAAASATVPPSQRAEPKHAVLPARIYFASGSAALDANAREALRSIANGLTGIPYVVEITGYVDAQGSPAKNRALAEQRARAVRDALAATGVPVDRLRLAPPASLVGHNDAAQARRVDISLAAR